MQKPTIRQQLLRWAYPALMKLTHKRALLLRNEHAATPLQSFYTLKAVLNGGNEASFDRFRNKKVLVVNTASDCGYTPQYKELQQLQDKYKDDLIVIGFPSNDFKEQEKGSDEAIARFCEVNYGISFLLAKKAVVVKSENQNPVFDWLCDPGKNGWNHQQPTWNFSKYLINKEGVLTHYFDPSVSPLSPELLESIEK
jgi:glutathione peroxidase